MKKLIAVVLFVGVCLSSGFGQNKEDLEMIREARSAAREDILAAKRQSRASKLVSPSFNDTDSFGKNVVFLGSLYAGTLYVYHSCDPAVLLAEVGLVLAPDDKCVTHSVASPMATTEVFDPVWEITIPGKTVKNVIYPMLNNGVGFDSFSSTGSGVTMFYVPRITIESDALNDPAAINPNTGLPMNGSFTTSLAGNRLQSFSIAAGDFISDYENYASVAGRGLSRSYFEALGLPPHVINQLFKKDMKLKFGIRARFIGPVDFAQAFYTFRLLGN